MTLKHSYNLSSQNEELKKSRKSYSMFDAPRFSVVAGCLPDLDCIWPAIRLNDTYTLKLSEKAEFVF